MNDEFEYSDQSIEDLEDVESSEILSDEESQEESDEEELSEESTSEQFIDYERLSAGVAEAIPSPQPFDSDLNDLPLSDVLLLIVALVLGILIVRSKS